MDDARTGYLTSFIVFFGLLLGIAGHAVDLEYISPEKQRELETAFDRANLVVSNDIKHKLWICDMYGVRSRLQVRRGIKLYQWSENGSWVNSGAQPVHEYRAQNGALVGTHDKLEDKIKFDPNGRLISRLSVIAPERKVVAYSVCTAPNG